MSRPPRSTASASVLARTKSRPWRRVSRRPAASATGRESSYISTTGESANSTEPATASPAIAPGKATAAASVGIRHLANDDRSRLAYWTSSRRESALVCVFFSTPLFLRGVKPWTCASLPLTPHLRNKTSARRTAGGCGSAVIFLSRNIKYPFPGFHADIAFDVAGRRRCGYRREQVARGMPPAAPTASAAIQGPGADTNPDRLRGR